MCDSYLPALAAAGMLVLAWLMARLEAKIRPAHPYWPDAEKPGLAAQLANSQESLDRILEPAGAEAGAQNRSNLRKLQYWDFAFIPLYVLFFASAACWNPLVTGLAVAAGIADYLEDFAILRALSPDASSSPRRFGQAKWLLFFATLAALGALLLVAVVSSGELRLVHMALGLVLLCNGLFGGYSSARCRFEGILSGAAFSTFGILGLAAISLPALEPVALGAVVQYLVALRVPLFVALFLLVLPVISFTAAKSLLRGLFDLTPGGIFSVTLATFAVAGAVTANASVILHHASQRFLQGVSSVEAPEQWWLRIIAALALPVIATSVAFSIRQGRSLTRCVLAALAGSILMLVSSWMLQHADWTRLTGLDRIEQWLEPSHLFTGYFGSSKRLLLDHLQAAAGFFVSLVLYGLLGCWGRMRLGKGYSVPALCSALMLTLMIAWPLSAATFFFDAWHVPILLLLAAVGTFTAQSAGSDHYYELVTRNSEPAQPPGEILTVTGRERVIAVAASGGGIQSAAWTAKVLSELNQCSESFAPALRMISAVSGGSTGSMYFVHHLADPHGSAHPVTAAQTSSLEAVAWGLVWRDLLRALLPWFFAWIAGRGRALEQAWRIAGSSSGGVSDPLGRPLSNWNAQTARGDIPAVVFNATIAETGERLLMATTAMGKGTSSGTARVDARNLHNINGEEKDVSIVTAARLSATFPYVTPASRSNGKGPQPHVVDGGYYDNYGMATLVEWLDQALEASYREIKQVMVIEIRGAKADPNPARQRHTQYRGWFFQAFAPLLTLANVRSAGQVAHNDIEIELLKQKWQGRVRIRRLLFEFPEIATPLSWHLTHEEQDCISAGWSKIGRRALRVKAFLERPEKGHKSFTTSGTR